MFRWSYYLTTFLRLPRTIIVRRGRIISRQFCLQQNIMASSSHPYAEWSPQDLLNRVLVLEKQLEEANKRSQRSSDGRMTLTEFRNDGLLKHNSEKITRPHSQSPRPTKKPRTFDWSKHSTRYIALKFAYLGRKYNGYEHHANNTTPLPTIEEALWLALTTAKLINPTGSVIGRTSTIDWEGCEYSKCGRTDRGVSAFGQVIGLRVRSNRPLLTSPQLAHVDDSCKTEPTETQKIGGPVPKVTADKSCSFDDSKDELPYIRILNSLLPSDIRVLAWCPKPPPDFSARFSCRARHYKYFFTQPAFAPTPGIQGLRLGQSISTRSAAKRREGWLDIEQMQKAVKRFEGLHDFRNFCKVDPSKQIYDYRRRIFRADIRPLTPEEDPAGYVCSHLFAEHNETQSHTARTIVPSPQVYVFDLQGSAFLWHQVRHMMAVLFLVGQGLESPSVVDALLDIKSCPQKPFYNMADEAPLVLWDCMFPTEDTIDPLSDGLDWHYVGEGLEPGQTRSRSNNSDKFGAGGIVDTVWALWRDAHMDTILRGSLLNRIVHQPDIFAEFPSYDPGAAGPLSRSVSQKIFLGGGVADNRGVYVPLLERPRQKSSEDQNREYAIKQAERGKSVRMYPLGGNSIENKRETRRDHDDD